MAHPTLISDANLFLGCRKFGHFSFFGIELFYLKYLMVWQNLPKLNRQMMSVWLFLWLQQRAKLYSKNCCSFVIRCKDLRSTSATDWLLNECWLAVIWSTVLKRKKITIIWIICLELSSFDAVSIIWQRKDFC